MTLAPILAAVGSKALLLLYAWLLSAIAASELSKAKGYGDKVGLGTGLLLSVVGPLIWLFIPARPNSRWAARRAGRDPSTVPAGADAPPSAVADEAPATKLHDAPPPSADDKS
jgi:hypothetical protein